MMIDTSLDAYAKVKETLSKRQEEVYDTLVKYPNRTSAELAKIMCLPLRSVAPRLTEMLQNNKIQRVDRRVCFVTGGNAYTLRVI